MVFVLQINLPSYIQAPTTAVPPPTTAVPVAIVSAQQTAEALSAAAEHHSSPRFHSGSKPSDMNADEVSATKHAVPQSHKHPSERENAPNSSESSSHGNEAMGSAVDSELALNDASLTHSTTFEGRLSSDRCPIVDAPDTDLTNLYGMDRHAHQECAVKERPDRHAKACKHDLQDTTAAAAGPLMTTDTEHMFSTAVAGHDAAMANEIDASRSSGGVHIAHHSSMTAAQVALLYSKSQQNLVGAWSSITHSITACYGDP